MNKHEEYFKKQRLILGPFLCLLIIVPWFPELLYGQIDPVGSILSSFGIVFVLLFFLSLFQMRIERKYREVSAIQKDYFIAGLPFCIVAIIPGLFTLGFDYLIPRFGLATICFMDSLIVVMFLALVRFPLAFSFGQWRTPITDSRVLASFAELARRMGVYNVSLYSVDWKRFKIANAFQIGPRKFSIYVSNYLLDNMSGEELNAVMAHELAHAKQKHVAKSLTIFLFPLLVGLNLLIISAVEMQTSMTLAMIPLITGLISMLLTPKIALGFQKRFELEADTIAVKILGDGNIMIGALHNLAQLNLISVSKDSLTHPSMMRRIHGIEEFDKERMSNTPGPVLPVVSFSSRE